MGSLEDAEDTHLTVSAHSISCSHPTLSVCEDASTPKPAAIPRSCDVIACANMVLTGRGSGENSVLESRGRGTSCGDAPGYVQSSRLYGGCRDNNACVSDIVGCSARQIRALRISVASRTMRQCCSSVYETSEGRRSLEVKQFWFSVRA